MHIDVVFYLLFVLYGDSVGCIWSIACSQTYICCAKHFSSEGSNRQTSEGKENMSWNQSKKTVWSVWELHINTKTTVRQNTEKPFIWTKTRCIFFSCFQQQ